MNRSYILRSVFCVLAVVVYIITLVLNAFGAPRSRPGFLKDLFGSNLSTGDVSDLYSTEITPAGWAFSIWGVIYTWQTLWLIYSVTLICRHHVPDVLNWGFHLLFIFSCVFNCTWLVIWQRLHIAASCVILFATAFNLYALLALSYYRFNKLYNGNFPKFDFYATQFLVHNGIALYATWCTIASLLNMTIAITYIEGVKNETACTIALSILTVEILAWFILENTVLDRYVRYTLTQYPVLIIALSAIISRHWDSSRTNPVFSLVLLILVCILFVVRLLLFWYRVSKSRQRKSEDMAFKEDYGSM